ncbi:MAG: hypothetical protein KAS65_08695 [Candidatus Aminicenantes bacterium]|nr:hypothetical protein [Candidatus Aminicenantes bacterium]
MENFIYMILNAFHNVAIIGCVAGPFYMARIVKKRSKYEKKIIYEMDRLMEDVITTQPLICWASLITLVTTGFGFPLIYVLFHGELKEMSIIGIIALGIKLLAVAGITVILYVGTFYYNPKLKELFARFQPEQNPDPEIMKQFFAIRALRKYWCDWCWRFGVLVLIASAILRWS